MSDLPFLDSFDHWATGQVTRKWTSYGSGSGAIVAGRNGNGMDPGSTNYLWKTFSTPRNTLFAGLAYKTSSFAGIPIQFRNVWPQVAGLQHIGDGRLVVVSSTGGLQSPPSTFIMNQNQWYYLELMAQTTRYTLIYEARVNGETILSGTLGATGGLDYGAGSTEQMNIFAIIGPGGGASSVVDDVLVNETDFQGDVRISVIRPNGAGTYADFTPNGGVAHYDRVNDMTPDDDTTILSAASSGLKETHNMEDITVTGTIKAVQALVCVKKSDAGSATVQRILINIAGTEDYSSDFYPSDSSYLYQRDGWLLSPFSGVAFTEAEINGLQLGTERTL